MVSLSCFLYFFVGDYMSSPRMLSIAKTSLTSFLRRFSSSFFTENCTASLSRRMFLAALRTFLACVRFASKFADCSGVIFMSFANSRKILSATFSDENAQWIVLSCSSFTRAISAASLLFRSRIPISASVGTSLRPVTSTTPFPKKLTLIGRPVFPSI